MRRLLVVADSSLIVEAVRIGLRSSGEFELVEQVEDQPSVGSIVDAGAEVVVLDEVDERERLLELIHELSVAAPALTLIVLTLSADSDWLDRLFSAGASGVLSKATPPAALATLIRETLEGRVLSLHRPPSAAGALTSRSAPDGPLSPRELEVLALVAAGSTNGEIARRLWVTEQTVKLRRTVLVGSRRMVVYDDGAPEPVRLFDRGVVYRDPETFGEYHLSYRSGDVISPRVDTYEPLGLQLADFVRAIREDDPMEAHTALARDVVSLVDAADRSLRQGGREMRPTGMAVSAGGLSSWHAQAACPERV